MGEDMCVDVCIDMYMDLCIGVGNDMSLQVCRIYMCIDASMECAETLPQPHPTAHVSV